MIRVSLFTWDLDPHQITLANNVIDDGGLGVSLTSEAARDYVEPGEQLVMSVWLVSIPG